MLHTVEKFIAFRWTLTFRCFCVYSLHSVLSICRCVLATHLDRLNLFGVVIYRKRLLKMVKLTPELINQSMQYINPCRDRELDLRGESVVFFFHTA